MSPAIPTDPDRAKQDEQSILAARLAAVFQVLPASLTSASVLTLLTSVVLWRLTRISTVWYWAAMLLSVNAWRASVLYRYRRSNPASADLAASLRWRRLFVGGCAAAGVTWGLLPLLVFPPQATLQVLIAFVLAGNAAGAVTSLSVERQAAFAFVLPSMLPLAMRLFLLGDVASIAMGIMVLMFVSMISNSVGRMSTQLRDLVVARMRADRHAQDLERTQARVNVLNDRLTMATRAGKIGVWEWNLVTQELVWDDALYDMYHIDPQCGPVNYETWRQRIHPQDIARTESLMSEVLQGQEVTTEFRVVWPDGTQRHLQCSATLQRAEDGTPLRLVGMNSDITELKDVGRLKNEFVSVVSHELRTPLTSIRGAVGLIPTVAASGDAAKLARLIDLANRNAERLAVLIDDILDMDKVECGRMRFDMRAQPLLPLLEQAVASNSTYAAMHRVTLALLAGTANVSIDVDTNRFLQVLANLLSNAAKFSPAGGRVEISANAVTRERVRILVTDHGPGISPEFQKKLFGKFCQGDANDNRLKSGSGLGLAISKAIIEQMQGSIGFQTSSAGTTFFIDLPIQMGEDGAGIDDAARTTIVPLTLN